jgi:hypothetical protein
VGIPPPSVARLLRRISQPATMTRPNGRRLHSQPKRPRVAPGAATISILNSSCCGISRNESRGGLAVASVTRDGQPREISTRRNGGYLF